jgi:hypothetical protein
MLIIFENIVINLDNCNYFCRANNEKIESINFHFENETFCVEFLNPGEADKYFIKILKFRNECAAICICTESL